MLNKKDDALCSGCGVCGHVIELDNNERLERNMSKTQLLLQCQYCEKEWVIESKNCSVCGRPNKFPVKGPCLKCYQLSKRRTFK